MIAPLLVGYSNNAIIITIITKTKTTQKLEIEMHINTNSEAYKMGFEARGKAGAVDLGNCPFVINDDTPLDKIDEITQARTDYFAGHMDCNYHENEAAIAEASKPVPQEVERIGVDTAEPDSNKE